MHEHAAKLIPELSQWNGGYGIDLLSWVNCIGREDHAIGYAAYFWPDFAIHDDCIFLRQPDVDNYNKWMRECNGDKTRVESVMNHRHIVNMFGESEFEPTEEVLIHIGRLLRDMWSCKLQRDYPQRRVKVRFSEDDSEDLLDYEITLYQERD